MKAAYRDRYGSVDVVSVREVDKPVPTADRVLVRVHAASVNRADLDALYPRWQMTRLFLGFRNPRRTGMGLDVAGAVESVGPDANHFKAGDRVFGDMFNFGQSAFAEYVCASERAFLPIPEAMSFEAAATLPHSGVLAVQGLRLRDDRTFRAGERVMIVGASGNVGPFAVHIAKSGGAEVTGVASTGKLDFVRSLGADHVIDYTTTDYRHTGERYDWILDVDAHDSVLSWRDAMAPNGVYVALGGSSAWLFQTLLQAPAVRLATGKHMGLMLWWKPFNPPDVDRLTGLIASGSVRPNVDRQFALDELPDALRYVEAGKSRGKVVITIR